MGTDAAIFAAKARTYFDFDRLYNFACWDLGFEGQEKELRDRIMRQLWCDGHDENPTATASDVAAVADQSARYWREQRPEDVHRAVWNEQICTFVLAYPDDVFFLASTNDDLYYELTKSYQEMVVEDGKVIPYIPPPRRVDNRTPEEKARDWETMQQVQRALEAGPRLVLSPADREAFMIESLEPTLRKVCYDEAHLGATTKTSTGGSP